MNKERVNNSSEPTVMAEFRRTDTQQYRQLRRDGLLCSFELEASKGSLRIRAELAGALMSEVAGFGIIKEVGKKLAAIGISGASELESEISELIPEFAEFHVARATIMMKVKNSHGNTWQRIYSLPPVRGEIVVKRLTWSLHRCGEKYFHRYITDMIPEERPILVTAWKFNGCESSLCEGGR